MKHKKLSILIFVFLVTMLSFFYFVIDNKKVSGNTVQIATNGTVTKNEAVETTNDISPTSKPETPDMPILMYHYIRTLDDSNDKIGTNLSVNPEAFAKQLDLITERGYTTINFEDIETGNIPTKPVILTFDDGYADFYTSAYPELKKRNMKAVSYIIVNDIGKSNYMSRDQIIELRQNSIEIGSHTLSHPDLTKISPDKASAELTQSKEKLEAILGAKVISFCYPSGKVNTVVESITKNVGYTYAVTTNSKLANFSDLLLLNRYRVNHDTNISAYIK